MNPVIDEKPVRFEIPVLAIDTATSLLTVPAMDTIRTNWFTIGNSAELTTYFHGTDTAGVRLELVERTTMQVVVTPIPLETSTDSTVQEIKHTFLNGGNSEYRLQYFKTDPTAQYVEDIMVGEVDIDSIGSPRMGVDGGKHKYFDLSAGKTKNGSSSEGIQLASYPNPANDVIPITATQDAQSLEERGKGFYAKNIISMTISDGMGREISTYKLTPGTSISVPTQNLPNGMYFIRAQGSIFGKASSTFIVEH